MVRMSICLTCSVSLYPYHCLTHSVCPCLTPYPIPHSAILAFGISVTLTELFFSRSISIKVDISTRVVLLWNISNRVGLFREYLYQSWSFQRKSLTELVFSGNISDRVGLSKNISNRVGLFKEYLWQSWSFQGISLTKMIFSGNISNRVFCFQGLLRCRTWSHWRCGKRHRDRNQRPQLHLG